MTPSPLGPDDDRRQVWEHIKNLRKRRRDPRPLRRACRWRAAN
jgi:hypothetical protein